MQLAARKGQVFSIDFSLGMLITIAALISVVLFLPKNTQPFIMDAERISLLMTEGVPSDWNTTTLIVPGFLSNGRFNESKIAAFEALSVQAQKSLLGVQSDFSIRMRQNGTNISLCTSCGQVPASYQQLLTIERHALLGSNVTTMEVRLYG